MSATWECTCGLWSIRADHGWTIRHDTLHPVPTNTPDDATRRHHEHLETHDRHNPQ